MPDSNNQLYLKALNYASHGWPVFPIIPRGKKPLTQHGFKDATTDEAQIAAWWDQWPAANIGLPTGQPVGFWVLDVDGADGAATLAALKAKHPGEWPAGPVSRTGSGGLHYLFAYDDRIRNTVRFAAGLDTRADGGYIVAPSSVHSSGETYRWESSGEPPKAAEWIVDLIRKPERPPLEMNGSKPVGEGGRNQHLTRVAGKLRRIGMSDQVLIAALTVENGENCNPPLSIPEIEVIARSVARYRPTVDEIGPAVVSPPEVKIMSAPDFCAHEWPIRYDLLRPWLKEASLSMLHASRGAGKTWIAATIALCVSGGYDGRAFGWSLAEPHGVLYVDAEMSPDELSRRFKLLCPQSFLPEELRILSAMAADGPVPSLSTPEGRILIEDCIGNSSLLILDNVSTLWSGAGDYNAAESWDVAQDWLLQLRRRGVAVLVIDHAGKTQGRGPRGTSRKEDIMDVCVELHRPDDTAPDDGAVFVWRYTKTRGLVAACSVRAQLKVVNTAAGMVAHWIVEDDASDMRSLILEMNEAGASLRTISRDLAVSKSTVHRILSRVEKDQKTET